MNLWICRRSYWAVVVLASTEAEARRLAEEAWTADEDWNANEPFRLERVEGNVAVIGWT